MAGSANLVVDYGYDYLQRLEAVRQYTGGARSDASTYRYDAVDRLSVQQEQHSGTANDRTTTFTYQGLTGLVTQEAQAGGTNARTKTFAYDGYGHRLAMTDIATGAPAETEPDRYTYGHDVHSSVSQLINQSGQVRASYGYDAYGGRDDTGGQALTSGDVDDLAPINPYRYSGKRIDSGTANSSGTAGTLPNGSGG